MSHTNSIKFYNLLQRVLDPIGFKTTGKNTIKTQNFIEIKKMSLVF